MRQQNHIVGYEGFVPPKLGGVRDQICTRSDPEVDCVEFQLLFSRDRGDPIHRNPALARVWRRPPRRPMLKPHEEASRVDPRIGKRFEGGELELGRGTLLQRTGRNCLARLAVGSCSSLPFW